MLRKFAIEQGFDLVECACGREAALEPGEVTVINDDLTQKLVVPQQSPHAVLGCHGCP